MPNLSSTLAYLSCHEERDATACSPSAGATLHFENPVVNLTTLRRVRIEPWAPVAVGQEATVSFSRLQARTEYRITLPHGLRGRYGGVTQEPRLIEFRTSDYQYRASASLGLQDGRIEPGLLGRFALQIDNTPEYFLAVRPVTPRELLLLGAHGAGQSPLDPRQLLQHSWARFPVSPTIPNRLDAAVDVKPWLDPTTGTATLLLDVSAAPPPQPEQATDDSDYRGYPTLLSVSNLALTTKLWLDGGLVWVTSLDAQLPVANVRLSLLDARSSTLLGVTGADGVLELPAAALKQLWLVDPRYLEEPVGHRRGLALLNHRL